MTKNAAKCQCGHILVTDEEKRMGLCEICQRHLDELSSQPNIFNGYMQVTREMALDAGDVRLEGQWIQI